MQLWISSLRQKEQNESTISHNYISVNSCRDMVVIYDARTGIWSNNGWGTLARVHASRYDFRS